MNIRDIAKLAGVGVSTVSRVLNNHPDVKESTREKVLEIIKDSNYIPNNSARILKQNNTKNIGVLAKGGFNPFFSEMKLSFRAFVLPQKPDLVVKANSKYERMFMLVIIVMAILSIVLGVFSSPFINKIASLLGGNAL